MEESVTLVTAKNQHRCWKARTCARKTRMCVDLYVLGEGANEKLSLGLSSLEVCFYGILLTLESKTRYIKRK